MRRGPLHKGAWRKINFERKILRKIHGHVRVQNGEYERRKNAELEG